MSIPSFIASFDSASGMALANAHALRGEDFDALGQSKAMKPAARSVRWLPRKVREGIFIVSGATETISPRRVHRLDFEEVGEWLSEEYPPGPFPAVAIGSSSGALTHLYTALRIPWLPQTTLVPVRQRVHPDDPMDALKRGRKYGLKMMKAYPDLQLHHMHDANQDRMMVRALTYFRVKRRNLGPDYERFLTDRLQPGGTILVAECRSTWKTTKVGERYYFQHGAPGGIDQQEYHRGSERVAEYLERYDSPVHRWHGPEPDTESPEAEWGFESALLDDIERFAAERGYRVVRLVVDEAEDASPMVADLYQWWYEQRRIPSNRLIVSSFLLMEPLWTLRTGAVPFWMKFNTEPSLERLNDYLSTVPTYDEIYLMLFQHGVEAAGLPPKDRWQKVLERARTRGEPLGLDLDEYPLDFSHFARYGEAIQEKIRSRYPLPPPLPLSELDRFLTERADDYAVTWTGVNA